MKLKNTGNKIVSVGETLILPGKTETVPDAYKDNPVVQLYVARGTLAAVKDGAKASGTKASGTKAPDQKAPDQKAPDQNTPEGGAQ